MYISGADQINAQGTILQMQLLEFYNFSFFIKKLIQSSYRSPATEELNQQLSVNSKIKDSGILVNLGLLLNWSLDLHPEYHNNVNVSLLSTSIRILVLTNQKQHCFEHKIRKKNDIVLNIKQKKKKRKCCLQPG